MKKFFAGFWRFMEIFTTVLSFWLPWIMGYFIWSTFTKAMAVAYPATFMLKDQSFVVGTVIANGITGLIAMGVWATINYLEREQDKNGDKLSTLLIEVKELKDTLRSTREMIYGTKTRLQDISEFVRETHKK